jgi:ABC-type glycerol-3-phosphate transport system permease component
MFETRGRTGRILLQVVLTLLIVPFAYPLIEMVRGSLVGDGIGNYVAVLTRPELPLFFRNSIIISAGTIIVVYVCTMLAAFGFSKLRVRARELLFWMLLICLTLPEVVLIAPLFVTSLALGLYNTYAAVILPMAALQIPFAVLLARTFVDGIPNELLEAARVDGASAFQSFVSVILPLTKPIAATIVVLSFIGSWNAYLLPLVFLTDADSQTITLLPQFFIGEFSYDQTKVLASSVVSALPEVVAYICLQRFFERGLAAGAIK